MVNFFVYEAIITVGRDEMSVKRTVSLHLQLLHVYVHMDVTIKGTDLELSITLLLHSVAKYL